MSYAQFWEQDPWIVAAYRAANDLNRQRKSEEMWLQGLYNFNAVSTALSNLNFGKKRRKPHQYIEEPIRVSPLTEAEKAAKAEIERQKAIDYFDKLEKQWKTKEP